MLDSNTLILGGLVGVVGIAALSIYSQQKEIVTALTVYKQEEKKGPVFDFESKSIFGPKIYGDRVRVRSREIPEENMYERSREMYWDIMGGYRNDNIVDDRPSGKAI